MSQFFCRMRYQMVFFYFLKMSFSSNWEDFWLRIRKFSKLEKLENMKKQITFKKTLPCFKKASLPEWKGRKYAGGSRPSCSVTIETGFQFSFSGMFSKKTDGCSAVKFRSINQSFSVPSNFRLV